MPLKPSVLRSSAVLAQAPAALGATPTYTLAHCRASLNLMSIT